MKGPEGYRQKEGGKALHAYPPSKKVITPSTLLLFQELLSAAYVQALRQLRLVGTHIASVNAEYAVVGRLAYCAVCYSVGYACARAFSRHAHLVEIKAALACHEAELNRAVTFYGGVECGHLPTLMVNDDLPSVASPCATSTVNVVPSLAYGAALNHNSHVPLMVISGVVA